MANLIMSYEMVNNAKYIVNSLFDQAWYHSFIHAFLCVTM